MAVMSSTCINLNTGNSTETSRTGSNIESMNMYIYIAPIRQSPQRC